MEKGVKRPLVSVIIPAYNVEKYIIDTIRSVTRQTYSNIEIIVVNDGSADNTRQVIEGECKNSPSIKLINQPNSGASAARNTGCKMANGELIKFLDGDDLINTEMIAQQVSLIENDNCIISAKWGRFYNDDTTTFKLSHEDCWQTMPPVEWISASWKNARPMTNPGIFLIPKKLIEKAGLWDEGLSLLDDTEYFARTILAAEKVIFSKDSILYYRSGINGMSALNTRKGIESAYLAINKAVSALINKQNDAHTRLSCANLWQSFVYWIYPEQPDLVAKAEQEIKNYGGSLLKNNPGGYSQLLQNVIGWKLMKKVKLWFRI